MKEPKNQHQLVLWYLLNFKDPFSLKEVINDSMFFKFQTRLGEIETKHGEITIKKQRIFIMEEKAKKLVDSFKNKNEIGMLVSPYLAQRCAIISARNEYHASRELLFNLKSCGVNITEKVYLFRLYQLLNEEIDLIREIRKL